MRWQSTLAESGILSGEKTWVHRRPLEEGHLEIRAALAGETVSPPRLPQLELLVEQVLV